MKETVTPIMDSVPRVGAMFGCGHSLSWEIVGDPEFPADAVIRPSAKKTLVEVAAFGEFLRRRAAKRAADIEVGKTARRAVQGRANKAGARARERRTAAGAAVAA